MENDSNRVLWRMRGPRRVIVATLRSQPQGHEMAIFFEDDNRDVIEIQSDPATQGLVARAETVKEILRRRGLVVVEGQGESR